MMCLQTKGLKSNKNNTVEKLLTLYIQIVMKAAWHQYEMMGVGIFVQINNVSATAPSATSARSYIAKFHSCTSGRLPCTT